MSISRRVATAFTILSLAFALGGCSGASGGDEPQTEPETQEVVQEGEQESPEEEPPTEEPAADDAAADPSSAGTRFASVADEAADDVALVAGEWGCSQLKSVDALANALINGDVDFALVTPQVASALYNATAGGIMAVDAVRHGEAEPPCAVTVVRLPYFGTNPDDVVAFVARHQELVEASYGAGTFLRGSAMQRELTSAITDAYVEDPSSIGGTLPPDNFYFLG